METTNMLSGPTCTKDTDANFLLSCRNMKANAPKYSQYSDAILGLAGFPLSAEPPHPATASTTRAGMSRSGRSSNLRRSKSMNKEMTRNLTAALHDDRDDNSSRHMVEATPALPKRESRRHTTRARARKSSSRSLSASRKINCNSKGGGPGAVDLPRGLLPNTKSNISMDGSNLGRHPISAFGSAPSLRSGSRISGSRRSKLETPTLNHSPTPIADTASNGTRPLSIATIKKHAMPSEAPEEPAVSFAMRRVKSMEALQVRGGSGHTRKHRTCERLSPQRRNGGVATTRMSHSSSMSMRRRPGRELSPGIAGVAFGGLARRRVKSGTSLPLMARDPSDMLVPTSNSSQLSSPNDNDRSQQQRVGGRTRPKSALSKHKGSLVSYQLRQMLRQDLEKELRTPKVQLVGNVESAAETISSPPKPHGTACCTVEDSNSELDYGGGELLDNDSDGSGKGISKPTEKSVGSYVHPLATSSKRESSNSVTELSSLELRSRLTKDADNKPKTKMSAADIAQPAPVRSFALFGNIKVDPATTAGAGATSITTMLRNSPIFQQPTGANSTTAVAATRGDNVRSRQHMPMSARPKTAMTQRPKGCLETTNTKTDAEANALTNVLKYFHDAVVGGVETQ